MPYTIGVTGGSGSGKTYFINQLCRRFGPGELSLLPQDHYYFPRDQQKVDEKGWKNFDLPEAIDLDQFLTDLRRLKQGHRIQRTEYTYNNPKATPKTIEIEPAPVILVEGLFLFSSAEMRSELDLRVFIDAKDHLKLTRRIRRDNQERGYDLQDVLYRYENHVMPVYESAIAPLKDEADLIIPNNRDFTAALEVIVTFIKSRMNA